VRSDRLIPPLVVGAVAVILGRLTMLPGVGFWDTAELQTVAPVLGTAHPTGFPTYVILGWLASIVLGPLGEPAFRMNLLAALCIGFAAAVTVDLVRSMTRSVALGVAVGFGVAVTPIVWRLATQAETHALHLALVALLFRLLVAWEARRRAERPTADRWLVVATIVFGLSVGNHSLTLLLAIPVGLYVLAVEPGILRRPAFIATCTAALVATIVLLYLELPLRAGPFRAPLVYGRPETWDGFWYVVLAEQFRGSLFDPFGDLGGKLVRLAGLAGAQFGPLALLLPAGFAATIMRRPRLALLTGSFVAITCFFNASYINADIGRYYAGPILAGWLWLAILAGVVATSAARAGRRARARFARTSRRELAAAGLAVLFVLPGVLALPARQAAVDRSANDLAARWLDITLTRIVPDAVVVSWWSFSTTLWYAQHVEGRRPDIWIVDDRTLIDEELGAFTDVIDANLDSRPVYVIRSEPADLDILRERYVADGPILEDTPVRIVARRGATP
jgi:hypothetical protein